MIETVIKGVIIGILISIPLGPIGVLCVQRTLNRGRRYGIATGLGATFSDLFYTIIALFFIGFVVDYIETRQTIIQIIGSFIVIVFGFFIYRNNSVRTQIPKKNSNDSLIGDFFSSFILTFSNPLILFVLIALFARFNFLNENTTVFHNVIGIFSILIGAYLWWSTLTFLVSKFRNKLTYTGIKLLNRVIGMIIMGIGIVGIVLSLFSVYI
ncbi:LysE family transporter [Paludibacter sp.]